jgi:hypothetical protein
LFDPEISREASRQLCEVCLIDRCGSYQSVNLTNQNCVYEGIRQHHHQDSQDHGNPTRHRMFIRRYSQEQFPQCVKQAPKQDRDSQRYQKRTTDH